MKKYSLLLFLLFVASVAVGQKQCSCNDTSKVDINERISCKDIILKNKAKLYWQFNCDSSWLTFESRLGKKKIIFSMELVEYTGRLGFSYSAEYRKGFLIRNGLISGCCTPPEFILFDKNTGNEIINYGQLIFYSEDYKVPLIACYKNDAIIIRNVNTNKREVIKLPKGLIERARKASIQPDEEYLFDTDLTHNALTIKYNYLKPNTKNTWLSKSIKIDLAKYREQ